MLTSYCTLEIVPISWCVDREVTAATERTVYTVTIPPLIRVIVYRIVAQTCDAITVG